ncbi:CapA family protein [Vibrio splendidus]
MIFCGDTTFPFSDNVESLLKLPVDFKNAAKIVNLEALILDSNLPKKTTGIALSNSPNVLGFLQDFNVIGASLANNHICDFDLSIDGQLERLKIAGVTGFGAGDCISKAASPFVYEEKGEVFLVLTFGWNVIGCTYATDYSPGVNPMEPSYVIKQATYFLNENPGANIIITFHNNYEFELYPQPAHRSLFFDLIELGVKAIFCHHPHIVGGCEIYKGCPIFYSLGNFYLPEYQYNGYNLSYPEISREGLCVDYRKDISDIQLHWTYKCQDNTLSLTCTESLSDSTKINLLTPFNGMSHSEYILWFKLNRKKKKLLPIYRNYQSENEAAFNNFIVRHRQKTIDFLVGLGIK